MPKIGITTSTLDNKKWYKELANIKVLEVGLRSARFFFDPEWIDKIKPFLKGIDLSMHSGTIKVFVGNEQFVKTELETLRAEILCCEMIGAKELIFHLKHDKLLPNEERELRQIINFAKQHNVEMIFESNGILVADVALDFLKRIPDVQYNLDLGHLNHGIGKDMLGMPLDQFLSQIKDRTTYVHAHNNNGQKDNHQSLVNGTLDWKHVLNILGKDKIKKIIIECRTKEDVGESIKALEQYI
tara:strand:- start:7160 stop:7885 length:726 start_codon:yes stop_codon:yes gene_type:complete